MVCFQQPRLLGGLRGGGRDVRAQRRGRCFPPVRQRHVEGEVKRCPPPSQARGPSPLSVAPWLTGLPAPPVRVPGEPARRRRPFPSSSGALKGGTRRFPRGGRQGAARERGPALRRRGRPGSAAPVSPASPLKAGYCHSVDSSEVVTGDSFSILFFFSRLRFS